MSIRLAACCYSFNVKELFKLPTRDFPPITPSTENLNRNFPKQPLLLENLRYFGNWPMTSQEMSSRSYIISKHITVKAFKNVLTCKDLAALARQGNSWGRLVGSLITVFSPNPPAQVDWWDSFNAVIWQNEVSFSQGNWTCKGSHCSRWFPGGDQSLFSESSNFRFVISVSNLSRRSRY